MTPAGVTKGPEERCATGVPRTSDGIGLPPVLPGAAGWNVYGGSTLAEFVPGQPHPGCDVYWGSHGCCEPRGHDPAITPHACDCCECRNHPDPDSGCVARPPYYGPGTRFYGDDAPDGTFGEWVRAETLRVFGLKPWHLGIGTPPDLSGMHREYHKRAKARARRRPKR